MKIDSLSNLKRNAIRAFPGLAAPKGAAIICIYLIGMTGIALGAYAMRGRLHETPVTVADVAATLPQPAVERERHLAPDVARPAGQSRGNSPEAPRLTSLSLSETRLGDDLVSPLSRVFLGQPSAVPPARPSRNAPGLPDDTTETTQAENPALQTPVRPRLRPSPPETGTGQETPRLANLATPGATQGIEEAADCPGRLASGFPRRPGNAPDAQTFMANVQGIDGVKRDSRVAREILRGNMPRFLHNLVPVNISGRAADGSSTDITICVTPDYLALGSDRDYIRVPLGLRAATRIGEEFNMLLPTPRMVDMIYRAAALRLAPRPMSPGPQMTSTAYFMRHNATIEAQRRSAGAAPGTLISGHKKDVVLSTRLASHRGRVAIYGWHRSNGQPIQPLSTVHGAGYADYSHGVRLVSRTAFLNGRPTDLRSLMADPRYAGLLSDEGPIGGPRLRMAALASN